MYKIADIEQLSHFNTNEHLLTMIFYFKANCILSLFCVKILKQNHNP